MVGFTFTRVVVIESLLSKEFKSGTYLHSHLVGLAENNAVDVNMPRADLFPIKSAEEFCECLRALTAEAQEKGDIPILHIEAHGCGDKTGIVFSDASFMLWEELSPLLADLNRATGFNLLVCVAACFGAHFLEEVRPGSASPCWGIIGPTDLTDGSELLGRFRDFYHQLITTLDGSTAVRALLKDRLNSGGFLVEMAEDWFVKLIDGYMETKCTRQVMEQRASALYAKVLAEGNQISIEQVKEICRKRNQEFVGDCFAKFFMTASVPKNLERYDDLLSGARTRINNFLEAQEF